MSTTIFACGMECGIVDANVHWSFVGSPPSFSTSTVRTGARSLRCNAIGSIMGASTPFSLFPADFHHVGRFYVYIVSHLGPTDFAIASYGSPANGGPCARLVAGSIGDRKIYAAVGGTLGATGISVELNQWYRIDYDFNVNTAGADFSDVKVNGVACGQATGTGVSIQAGVDQIGVLAATTADLYIDDFVCSASAADYPIGPGYGAHFIPTADGVHNIAGAADFKRGAAGTDIINSTTDAFQLIDKVPIPDAVVTDDFINAIAPPNATDYVEVVFGPASPFGAPAIAPQGIDVVVAHHQAATQSGNIRLALNDNGTLDDVLNLTANGQTTLRYARKHYSDPPSAASAWVVGGGGDGDITDLRMRFFSSDAAPDQYWDCAMIEADFPTISILFPNQQINAGSSVQVDDDLRASLPSTYQLESNIPNETASTVVTTVISSQTADGEVPQQQVIIESQGGGEVGKTALPPGVQVRAVTSVAGAATNVELTRTAS